MVLIVQCDNLASGRPVVVWVIVGRVDPETGRIDSYQVTLVHVNVLLKILLAKAK